MKGFVKNKRILLFLCILIITSFASEASALETVWPSSPAGTELTDESTLSVLLQYLYEWGIALGGLVMFIALLIAGFQYLSSAGNPTTMKEAIDRIKSALLGLVLLLGSWLILNTINPELTSFQDPLLPLNVPETPTSDVGSWGDRFVPCNKVEVDAPGATQTVTSEVQNQCGDITISAGDSFDTQGFYNDVKEGEEIGEEPDKKKVVCTGTLQLFSRIDCNDMITSAPPTNKSMSVDTTIRSVKFFYVEVTEPE